MEKKSIILLLGIFAIITLATFVNAQLIYKQYTDIDLKIPCKSNETICSNSAICNISVTNSNATLVIDNQAMTNLNNGFFSYLVSKNDTSVRGEYQAFVYCTDNDLQGANIIVFTITGTGRAEPSSLLTISFIAVFVVSLVFYLLSLLNIFACFAKKDTNVKDLLYSFIVYIAMVFIYIFNYTYFGNEVISNVLGLMIKFGAFTHLLVPVIAIIFSLNLIKKQKELAR